MDGTRKQRQAELEKVFMLFDNDITDNIFWCFAQNRIRSMPQIISYDLPAIQALTYIPYSSPATEVKKDDAKDDKSLASTSKPAKPFVFPTSSAS